MSTAVTYDISGPYTKGSSKIPNKQVTSAKTKVDSDDKYIVNLDVSSLGMIPGEVYTLVPKTSARDIANNASSIKDVSFEFVASSIEIKNYIKGVAVINGRKIEVRGTSDLAAVVVKNNGVEIQDPTAISYDGSVATVVLLEPLVDGVSYTVDATVGGTAASYGFGGILSDGGLDVYAEGDPITAYYAIFSDWDEDNHVVKFVYEQVYKELTFVAAKGYDATGGAPAALGVTDVDSGADYIIEVYNKVDGVAEKAPVYTKVFTK